MSGFATPIKVGMIGGAPAEYRRAGFAELCAVCARVMVLQRGAELGEEIFSSNEGNRQKEEKDFHSSLQTRFLSH
jgi:hypothetical protein